LIGNISDRKLRSSVKGALFFVWINLTLYTGCGITLKNLNPVLITKRSAKMSKNIIKKILLLVVISIVMTSCSTKEATKETTKETNISGDTNGKAKLVIYTSETILGGSYLTRAIEEFNENNKNVQIMPKDFKNDWEGFRNKMATGLVAGDGPDIIMFNTSTFTSIHKAIESGAFYDLNALIKDDKYFKLSDYNEKVLQSGVFNNKRYIIPVGYFINTVTTTKEQMDRDKVSFDKYERLTWKEVSEVADEYMKTHKNKYFFEYLPSAFFSSTDNFVDVDNKKCNFKCPEFIELLDEYKKIYNASLPYEKSRGKDDKYFKNNTFAYPDNAFMRNGFTIAYKDLNKIVYPIEMSEEKGKVSAKPAYMVAINSQCKQKGAAYDFIKLLLSEKIQSIFEFAAVPVNKAAFELDKTVDTDLTALAKRLNENIGNCEISDVGVYSIISQEVKDFLNNKKTAEQTAAAAQDKVNIFLNE
jgi:ABC-type glycerol-3-phosphate transport system substrate-binding protein